MTNWNDAYYHLYVSLRPGADAVKAQAKASQLVRRYAPAFDALTGDAVGVPYGNGLFWLIMLSVVFLTGLLAGSRPAFFLSSFQPVKVSKGDLTTSRRYPGRWFRQGWSSRKVLVVLQFTCSIALTISTITVY